MATEHSAGAVVYRVTAADTPVYLLLQPAPGKPWGFPKGKRQVGETDEQTARREIAEESGLTDLEFDPGFRYVVHYVYRRGRTQVKKDVVYFLARTHMRTINLSHEHVAARWEPFADGRDYVVYESAQATLAAADAFLRTRSLAVSADDES
jgi:bis(5'-nucleosidyl)-tetraphosphatase